MRLVDTKESIEQEKRAKRTPLERSQARYVRQVEIKVEKRNCRFCRKKYVPKIKTQKFCSKKCAAKSNATKPRKKKEIKIGTIRRNSKGYNQIYTNKGWILEHRLKMEKILGRPLVKGESIHHKDGVRHNNDPDNLELWVVGVRYGQRGHELMCPHCGKSYLVEE
jgi:hypothetical protein